MFNSASESAAEWATLEEYLKKVVCEPLHQKTDLREYTLADKHGKILPQHAEYHIYGPSGTGKTTWMLNQVIKLCREYNPCWMYLEQDMTIPTSSCITIREYLRDYLNIDYGGVDNIILKWAEYLQISSIINGDTLDKSFNSPSGGEKKRINILRMLLPIFTYQSSIKVLFLDEITSGLDDDTHKIVRKLMDKLKKEFKITVINIDHHTIGSPHCKVHIEKTGEGKCPYLERDLEGEGKAETPTTCMKYLQILDFVNKYQKEEEEDEEEDDTPSFPPVIEIGRSEIIDN
jgi:ATPase subunit of ABC transporter with duplicated ATPase domains